jgi:predicted Rossmann-fold nucleotide-binding protein
MEAASRGAREGGGRTVGITCAIFAGRCPNAWLDEVVEARDLHERTGELLDRAGGYVILPGKAGTLAELAQLWALERAGCLGGRPVVLLGDCWPPLLHTLQRIGMLESPQLRSAKLVGSPAEAVEFLAPRVCARRREGP